MTWKGLFVLAAFGAAVATDGRLLPQDPTDTTLEAELAGTRIAGRIPTGTAVVPRDPEEVSSLELELQLPEGTELTSWLNDSANAPCEGHALGTAALDEGVATWELDAQNSLLRGAAEGSFLSICAGGAPVASGNLRGTG
jgi:hypothetical protein